MSKWFGFALEGTLAKPSAAGKGVGTPVPEMVARARTLLDSGRDVRIVTPAALDPAAAEVVRAWLRQVGLDGAGLAAACDEQTAGFVGSAHPKTKTSVRTHMRMREAEPLPGAMRMGVMCPHCHGVALIRNSRQLSELLREVFCQCQDLRCGYTFKAMLEAVQGISPSATPDPEVARLIDAKCSGHEAARRP